jgi:predicted lactoylglutathione lyase
MQNKKTVYINLPVADVTISERFYSALGFNKNPMFSDERACCMVWSEEIIVMLLQRDYYQTFLSNKKVGNTKETSNVLLALSMNSKEEVQKFADTAKSLGGDYFVSEPNKGLDFIFGYEVSDPDGHTWEPTFMDMGKFTQE